MIDNMVADSLFIGYSACNDALGCRVPASDGTYAVTLDDATRRYLDWCASQGIPRLHEMSPSEARAFEAGFRHLYGPGPAMYRELEATVEADGRTIALRCLIPKDDPDAVVVYYHGGGWVVGDIDDYTTFGRILAERTGAVVVLVNYRLAPEHPYPAALEDAWSALCWVDERLSHLTGNGTSPLVVAGDSAGGCLAAVIAQRAKQRNGPPLALQVLLCPVTDCDLTTPSYRDQVNELRLTTDTMRWFWDLYLPDTRERRHPDASPLRSQDVAGLPPAIIVTAEHDVLRDDGERYAAHLQGAGVSVSLRRFAGQMHGFISMINVIPASEDAIDYIARGIRSSLLQESPGEHGAGRSQA
jgi:acetyl esterase